MSNLVMRASRVAPQNLAVALIGGVAQLPHTVLPFPDVGRAEAVGQVHEVIPVHLGLFKQLAGPGEVLAVQRQILENFLLKAVGVLAVELLAQRLAFVQRDFLVADLLRCIVGRAADAVLDVGGVVEEIVDFVVDGVVLGVGSLGALRRGAETAVLDTVIVRALRVPLFVVARYRTWMWFFSRLEVSLGR